MSKSIRIVMVLSVFCGAALAFCLWEPYRALSQDEKTAPKKKPDAKLELDQAKFMRLKLEASSQILEGLVTEDSELIVKGAKGPGENEHGREVAGAAQRSIQTAQHRIPAGRRETGGSRGKRKLRSREFKVDRNDDEVHRLSQVCPRNSSRQPLKSLRKSPHQGTRCASGTPVSRSRSRKRRSSTTSAFTRRYHGRQSHGGSDPEAIRVTIIDR